MDPFTRQSIQIDRQGGDQRLTLAGTHFGNLAIMQHHAADHLHVEVAHVQDPLSDLADHGKRLRHQVIEFFTLLKPGSELIRLGPQLLIRKFLDLRLQPVDLGNHLQHPLDKAVITTTKDLLENLTDHEKTLDDLN